MRYSIRHIAELDMEKRAWIAMGVCFIVAFFLIIPARIIAVRNICSAEGYAIVYINGIFTDETKAKVDMHELYKEYAKRFQNLTETDFHLGYNQTHLGGIGDLFKSIQQKMWEVEGETKEDFDLLTIARQLEGEITTQKILIIGHSQGTFYANALYDYLIRRGTPARSIAVYNIATPGSYVAGHGRYLTNENDAVINSVRKAAVQSGYPSPLPANINIPARSEDVGNEWAGHSIANVYLAERPTDIASTISFLLSRLESDPTRDSGQPCIPPPESSLSYFVKKIAFGVTDPIGSATRPVIATASVIGNAVVNYVFTPVFTIERKLADTLSELFAKVLASNINAQPAAVTASLIGVSQTYDNATYNSDNEVVSEPKGEVLDVSQTYVNEDRESSDQDDDQGVVFVPSAPLTQDATSLLPIKTLPPPSVVSVPTVATLPPPPPPPPSILSPRGFAPGGGAWGGGGGGGNSAPTASSNVVLSETPTSTPLAEPAPKPQATLSVVNPQNNLNTKNTTPMISGTADPAAVVTLTTASTTATTSANSFGAWSFDLTFTEGQHTLSFSALNTAGATSTTIARGITIDVTSPIQPSSLNVVECSYSLTSSICLIPETTVVATWGAVEGADSYTVYVGNIQTATTSGTNTSISLPDNTTSSITISAYDVAGNKSATSSAKLVTVMSQPAIINEVAWAGTMANGEDEWVELKNLSSYVIDMEKLLLSAADGSPFITLTGTLAATTSDNNTDLYLIERRSDATTADHNRVTLFEQLANSGEELRLMHTTGNASTTIDKTPATATCSGWCAGSLPIAVQYSPEQGTVEATLSMERIAGRMDGTLASSWRNNDTYTKSASDASGGFIYGTLVRENSVGLPSAGWYCSPDTTSITTGSTYKPVGNTCTYLSNFIHPNASRWGFLFKGSPGNSEDKFAHSIGKTNIKEEAFGAGITGSAGDNFFVTIFETRTFGDDLSDFTNWFKYGTTTTGSTTPPHTNYRIIKWIYGP